MCVAIEVGGCVSGVSDVLAGIEIIFLHYVLSTLPGSLAVDPHLRNVYDLVWCGCYQVKQKPFSINRLGLALRIELANTLANACEMCVHTCRFVSNTDCHTPCGRTKAQKTSIVFQHPRGCRDNVPHTYVHAPRPAPLFYALRTSGHG